MRIIDFPRRWSPFLLPLRNRHERELICNPITSDNAMDCVITGSV